ncbi:MAG: enoyl-CoA hydratase/isomerase family protein [Steroidobacteraceae bacterium]
MAGEIIGLGELAALACSPVGEAASPLAGRPFLLLHLAGAARARGTQAQAGIERWLRAQPCPVLAIAEPGAHEALQRSCDVVAADERALEVAMDNIRHSPLAAMVLVQVLRATEQMPIEQALVVESLAYGTLQGGAEFRRWLAGRTPRGRPAARDPGPPVLLARIGNEVEIRLNRPSRRNAMSVEMREGLCEALELVAADPSITMARVAGNGEAFSSGGDLDEFGAAPDTATGHAVRSLRLPAKALLRCDGRVEFQVHGACIGAGVELPAFAPRVHAKRNTFFQLPEIRMGLIPGAGGCASIPRRIGRQRTALLALSAERIDAPTALAWGLIDAIAD